MDLLDDLVCMPPLGASFDGSMPFSATLLEQNDSSSSDGVVIGDVAMMVVDDDSSGAGHANASSSSEQISPMTVTETSSSEQQKRSQRSRRPRRRAGEDDDGDFELEVEQDDGRAKKKGKRGVSGKAHVGEEGVTLSRERLLTISSAEYEELLNGLGRPLTMEEQAEVRRQRRLIKNRESAALSRNRKKQAMEVLEEENAALRRELAAARAKLEQYERSRIAPGVLFVFLFGFGLFWGSGHLFSTMPSPLASQQLSQADIPNLRKLMSVDGSVSPSFLPNETDHWDDGIPEPRLPACNSAPPSCYDAAPHHSNDKPRVRAV